MELKKDLFVIPINKDSNIVYAPLRGVLFSANDNAVKVVKKYIDGVIMSDEESQSAVGKHLCKIERLQPKILHKKNILPTSHFTIILSQLCNLNCLYCYAKKSRSKETIAKEQLTKGLDYFLSQPIQDKSIIFTGGGEPTMAWDLLVYATEYALSSNNDTNLRFTIITNGTLLTDDKIDYIKKNNINIVLSFEVFSDMQNLQRGFADSELETFPIINKGIEKLTANNIPFKIRSTITRNNIHLMVDMVKYVAIHYKKLTKIHFELESNSESEDLEIYTDFVDAFFEARVVGKAYDVEVYNYTFSSTNSLKYRFCDGDFCLTPIGDISACHRVSSSREKLYDKFHYGSLECLDNLEVERIERMLDNKFEECEICFAKWHCAGGCIVERLAFCPEQMVAKCNSVREITKRVLKEKLLI